MNKKCKTYLPVYFVNEIQASSLSPKELSYCISIYHTLLYKIEESHEEWFPLSAQILKQNYGNSYCTCIRFLLDNCIIERNSYIIGQKTYGYRLSQSICVYSDASIYEYEYFAKHTPIAKKEFTAKSKTIIKKTCQFLNHLTFNQQEVEDWIMSTTEPGYKRMYYMASMLRLLNKQWYCKRNSTNTRLDTNLTGLKSELLDMVKLDNEKLVSIDLSNSQPLFLAKMMTDHYLKESIPLCPDIMNFQKAVSEGTLYAFIQKVMNLETRKEAKELMFMLLFSKPAYNPPAKKELKKHFPCLVEFCDSYKTIHGHNHLAIALQTEEASLFIDGILKDLLKQGFRVFSKHDSILCKEPDLEKVVEIVKNHLCTYFRDLNFGLQMK